ncbi:MAG: patatin-like phospholipase family protein [Acidimicrobiia bacterium]
MTTAFVLGGGGRWGAVEVGMLRALDEAGVRPDLVLGTSVGAFNGSVIADKPGPEGVERLTDLWIEIARSNVFQGGTFERVKNAATLKPSLHETSELRALLEQVHAKDRRIEELPIRFQCVAACIERAAEHWFTEGFLIDSILASSAVPALFPPVEIGGEHFYDGGLVNSVPLTRAVDLGATEVYVLQVGRIETPLRPPKRLHEAALIAFEIARRHRYATTVENLPDGIDLHLLPSANPVAFDDSRQRKWRDVSDTNELIEGAYEASTLYLGHRGR